MASESAIERGKKGSAMAGACVPVEVWHCLWGHLRAYVYTYDSCALLHLHRMLSSACRTTRAIWQGAPLRKTLHLTRHMWCTDGNYRLGYSRLDAYASGGGEAQGDACRVPVEHLRYHLTVDAFWHPNYEPDRPEGRSRRPRYNSPHTPMSLDGVGHRVVSSTDEGSFMALVSTRDENAAPVVRATEVSTGRHEAPKVARRWIMGGTLVCCAHAGPLGYVTVIDRAARDGSLTVVMGAAERSVEDNGWLPTTSARPPLVYCVCLWCSTTAETEGTAYAGEILFVTRVSRAEGCDLEYHVLPYAYRESKIPELSLGVVVPAGGRVRAYGDDSAHFHHRLDRATSLELFAVPVPEGASRYPGGRSLSIGLLCASGPTGYAGVDACPSGDVTVDCILHVDGTPSPPRASDALRLCADKRAACEERRSEESVVVQMLSADITAHPVRYEDARDSAMPEFHVPRVDVTIADLGQWCCPDTSIYKARNAARRYRRDADGPWRNRRGERAADFTRQERQRRAGTLLLTNARLHREALDSDALTTRGAKRQRTTPEPRPAAQSYAVIGGGRGCCPATQYIWNPPSDPDHALLSLVSSSVLALVDLKCA